MKDLCLETYTERITPLIFQENHYQLEKWGIQNHDPLQWLAFATEELGELAEAIGDWHFRNGATEDVVKEAIQTATLCIKIAEMFQEEGQ